MTHVLYLLLQAELSVDPSVDAFKSLVSGDTDVRFCHVSFARPSPGDQSWQTCGPASLQRPRGARSAVTGSSQRSAFGRDFAL